MAHILARLKAPIANVRQQLEKDADEHARQGMYLEHLWHNADSPDEVLFLFRVDNLDHCRQRMQQTHAEALQKNPSTPLPTMTFLDGA